MLLISEHQWCEDFAPINNSPMELADLIITHTDEFKNNFQDAVSNGLIWTIVQRDTPEDAVMERAGWGWNDDISAWQKDDETYDDTAILSGVHRVNRLGFYITEKPATVGVEVVSDHAMEIKNMIKDEGHEQTHMSM